MSDARRTATYGLATLTGLVIANMIGAGVFTTSGFALADLKTPTRVLAAWAVAGGIALCGAIAYGAMARALQVSGGEYLFLSRWAHPLLGCLAGWVSLLAGFTGAIALAALTLETYLRPSGGWLASAAILACVGLHGLRKAPGAWVQNVAVSAKLLLLGGFVILAFTQGTFQSNPAREATTSPFSWPRFAESLMWISLSYAGFNAAVYVSSEARSRESVPRALLLGTLITTVLYLGLNAVFVFAPTPEAIAGQEAVASIAAQALGSPLLETLTRLVIPLALFTSVSAMMLAGPRVYAQMAEDRYLPGWLRFDGETPFRAIVFQAILAVIVVWISSIRDLLTYLGFTLSLSSAAAVGSLFLVHRRKVSTVSVAALIAAGLYITMTVVSAAIGAWLNPWQGFAGILTLVLGWGIYRFTKAQQAAH